MTRSPRYDRRGNEGRGVIEGETEPVPPTPEDIQRLLEAIADPKHESHEDMLEWIGGEFDPEKFDLNAVNRELRKL